jgi:hypothetical protein
MSTFLDNQNIESLFREVSSKIFSITNYDMINNNKYKGVFTQLLETISETVDKKNNNTIEYLNNLAIKKTTPFMTDIIKKEQKTTINPTSNISQLNPRTLKNQNKKDMLSVKDYNPNQVNQLLSGLSLSADSKPNFNTNNDNKNKDNDKNNKMSFDEFVKSRNDFNNLSDQSEAAQKLLLKQINEKKQQSNKEFYDAMKPTVEQRPDLQFDPKDMYKDLMKTGKKVDVPKNNFNLEPPDLSEVNQIKESNPEVEKMLNNDWLQKDIQESSKISKEELFQNPGYVTERLKRKIIMIDTGYATDDAGLGGNLKSNLNTTTKTVVFSNTGNYWDDFTIKFLEPLVIDRPSEVIMESLIIKNSVSATNTQAFSIEFDQFNSQISSNNPNINKRFLVTNKNSASNNEKVLRTSSGRYITNINPTTIGSIKITLRDQDGNNSTDLPNTVFASSINRTSDVTIINNVVCEISGDSIITQSEAAGNLTNSPTANDIVFITFPTNSSNTTGFYTVASVDSNAFTIKETITDEGTVTLTAKLLKNTNNRFMMELLFKEL